MPLNQRKKSHNKKGFSDIENKHTIGKINKAKFYSMIKSTQLIIT